MAVVFNPFSGNLILIPGANATTEIALVADFASLPVSGVEGIIYITADTNLLYRWNGSTYLELSPGANTSLSNLTTTAVNQHLLPGADFTYNLGDASLKWNAIFSGNGFIDRLSVNTTLAPFAFQSKANGDNIAMRLYSADENLRSDFERNSTGLSVNAYDDANGVYQNIRLDGSNVQLNGFTDITLSISSTPKLNFNSSGLIPQNNDDIFLGTNDKIWTGSSSYYYNAKFLRIFDNQQPDNTGIPAFTMSYSSLSGDVDLTTVSPLNPAIIVSTRNETSATNVTGTIRVKTGDATFSGASSGPLQLRTGDSNTSVSGDIDLTSGSVVTGNSGNINIVTGSVTTGTRGNLILNANSIQAQSTLDLNSNLINNVLDPVSAQDASTKNYVDVNALKKQTGDINLTSGTILENQATPVNVTGFYFNTSTVRSFKALISITINATASLYESIELTGINKNGTFTIVPTSVGDNSLVLLDIDGTGQITYTSPTYSGFVSGKISFRAITTEI